MRKGEKTYFFSTQGFQKDDVMGILLPNCSSYILGLLGAMEAGLTVTTLNPAYTMPEVARQLEMSKAKIILTEESRVQAVKEAMKQIGMIKHCTKHANSSLVELYMANLATLFACFIICFTRTLRLF